MSRLILFQLFMCRLILIRLILSLVLDRLILSRLILSLMLDRLILSRLSGEIEPPNRWLRRIR